jgi:hypothetical protein
MEIFPVVVVVVVVVMVVAVDVIDCWSSIMAILVVQRHRPWLYLGMGCSNPFLDLFQIRSK